MEDISKPIDAKLLVKQEICNDFDNSQNLEILSMSNGNKSKEYINVSQTTIKDEVLSEEEEEKGNAEIFLSNEKTDDYNSNDDRKELEDSDECGNINRPSSILQYDLFNVRAEVDPCEVECVVTDTSDIDTDDEFVNKVLELKESDSNEAVNRCTRFLTSKRRSNALTSKSLPGLNRMEVFPKGFYCEVCDGKFDKHESMRELIKHMKTLHGFNCNFNSQKLSTIFKFKRSKLESSIKMQPGLVCPVCMSGWMSKRLLREHVTIAHGPKWIQAAPSGPLAYQCRYCSCNFWRASECHKHENDDHKNENAIQCHLCSETLLRKVCMNRHLKKCHPEAKLHSYISFKCKQCCKLFPVFELLDRHIRTWHPSSVVFRCPHCHSALKNKKSLYDHIKSQHRVNQSYQCEVCGRNMYSKRALSIHTQLKHHQTNKLRFKCRLCDKIFESKETRKEHYRDNHAHENIFQCRLCEKGFSSKSGLYGHKQVHLLSVDAFKCEHCTKEFSRRDSYIEHLQIHSGPRHKCPHCDKEFVQRSNMIRHIRIHTGEKPYKCSYCDKTFSDKGACNSHIRVHTREEVSHCTYCGKTFSKKQKLKYHLRKHTGEGLVECEICGKSFTHNSLLKDHRLIHNQQIQCLCRECGRAFNNTRYLARHIQAVHQPTHIYSCPMCTKTFTQQPRLREHLLTHATYKRLQCNICGKGLTTLSSLRKHLTIVHHLKKENPEYMEIIKNISSKRAVFLEIQKQVDNRLFMEGTPISEILKTEKEDDVTVNGNNEGSSKTVSCVGQKNLSKNRKSRSKCDDEYSVNEMFLEDR